MPRRPEKKPDAPPKGKKKLSPLPSQVKTAHGKAISEAQTGLPKPHYSDEDKAHALLVLEANDDNVKFTAAELNLPVSTLQSWKNERQVKPSVLIKKLGLRDELVDKLQLVLHVLTHYMLDPVKLKKASLPQVAVALGITAEKWHLLQGKATSIIGKEDSDDERRRRVVKIIEQIGPELLGEDRGKGPPLPPGDGGVGAGGPEAGGAPGDPPG